MTLERFLRKLRKNEETENSLDGLKSFLQQQFEKLEKSQKQLCVNTTNFDFNVKAIAGRLELSTLNTTEIIYFDNGEPVSINVKENKYGKDGSKIDFLTLRDIDGLSTTAPLTHAFYINQKK